MLESVFQYILINNKMFVISNVLIIIIKTACPIYFFNIWMKKNLIYLVVKSKIWMDSFFQNKIKL